MDKQCAGDVADVNKVLSGLCPPGSGVAVQSGPCLGMEKGVREGFLEVGGPRRRVSLHLQTHVCLGPCVPVLCSLLSRAPQEETRYVPGVGWGNRGAVLLIDPPWGLH